MIEPTFGIGIHRYIFGPLNDAALEMLKTNIEESMHKWLREYLELKNIEVTRDDEKLEIKLTYKITKTKTIVVYVFQTELE